MQWTNDSKPFLGFILWGIGFFLTNSIRAHSLWGNLVSTSWRSLATLPSSSYPSWILNSIIPCTFPLPSLLFLDLCFTSSIVPQLLVNLGSSDKSINTYGGCVVQLYVSLPWDPRRCPSGCNVLWPLCCSLPSSTLCLCHAPGSVASWPLWRGSVGWRPPPHSPPSPYNSLLWESQSGSFLLWTSVLIKLACVDTTFNQAELLWLVSYSWWCRCHSSWCPGGTLLKQFWR